ncbi:hypothetical protein ARC78_07440 [Stenotrophomonas pictorum JCM 9942]|uniref:Uncharacterized protein n=1 Tax=Stenotrophomonas pictorum JCM 9942 TaxID=1236960 RepID=A0A0R0AQ38_9GAMM|nr:hypothetical protein [Stenotrophomonas pictorum]KRG43191.1 hypothetical protein ARC78_07440 [Stenotrophomonas pictorum JCM 9942]
MSAHNEQPAAAQEAGLDAYDQALDQLWKLAGGNDSPVYKLFLGFRDSFAASVAAAQEAAAWFTDDHLTDRSATTFDPVVAERWRNKGWPVTKLYAAPVAAAPAMESIGKRKLMQLQDDGFIVNGVAIYNPETGRRGLVDYLGYVGWVGCTPAAPVGELDTGNLINDPLYLALDALYQRGWTDLHRKWKNDPRGTLEWDSVLDLFRAGKALASTPAAPGIDLEQFRMAVACWRASLPPDSEGRAKADHLFALINGEADASPKGGSDARDAARWRAIAPHLRVDWDESDEAQFCMWLHIKDDGVTVSRSPSHMHSTVDDAADLLVSAMQATSAEVGSWSCPRCGSKSGEQCSSCGCFSNEQDASHGAGVSE